MRRGHDVLSRLDILRINDRILVAAGEMLPPEHGSLDAIHLATAQSLEQDLSCVVTYDDRMITAAKALGMKVAKPV